MNTKRMMLTSMGAAALGSVLASAKAARAPAGGLRAGYFPNVVVQNQDGARLKFYDDIVRGKRVAFNMMYTACSGICPGNTANLLRVQEMLGSRLGRDVFMVSLTLRPEFDRPDALKAYAKRFGVGSGWTFLTGVPSEMDTIRRRLGFYDIDPRVDADIGQHTGMVRVGNEALDRWCMVPALGSPKQIVRAILET
jgi:protein SCO1